LGRNKRFYEVVDSCFAQIILLLFAEGQVFHPLLIYIMLCFSLTSRLVSHLLWWRRCQAPISKSAVHPLELFPATDLAGGFLWRRAHCASNYLLSVPTLYWSVTQCLFRFKAILEALCERPI